MEAANTHDPIENAKGRFLPNRRLQEVGVINPMISNQVNKGKIVSNLIVVWRSIRYCVKLNLYVMPHTMPAP